MSFVSWTTPVAGSIAHSMSACRSCAAGVSTVPKKTGKSLRVWRTSRSSRPVRTLRVRGSSFMAGGDGGGEELLGQQGPAQVVEQERVRMVMQGGDIQVDQRCQDLHPPPVVSVGLEELVEHG